MPVSDLGERLFVSLMKQRNLERFAVRALLKANELLGLALGARLAELRDSGEPLQAVFAESEANAIQHLLFFTLNREDFSFVIHLDRQPRTSSGS